MYVVYCILPHSALSRNFSLTENLANLSLQDRATKWYYFPPGPSIHPPGTISFKTGFPLKK